MSRTQSILMMVLIASSISVNAQQSNRDRYFDDFRGQSFCGTRQRTREGTCCSSRYDECSVPIAGTLCYCDEFCDQHINPDCCPDYENVCKGGPPPTDNRMCRDFEKVKVNCNECDCRGGELVNCEKDACLIQEEVLNLVTIDGSKLGWKAQNYSEFWGRKLSEGLEYRLGTFEPRVRVKSMSRLTNKLETLPSEFNSLNNWPGMISSIRDQGWCGSSWAVSTASVASDRFGIKSSKTGEPVDLSAQHMLSCVRHQQGCKGGHLDNAWRYLNRLGVADEDCYKYEASVGRCRAKKNDNLRTMQCNIPNNRHDGLYKMGPAYSLNNETDIRFEIFHYGPVQATMWVYQDFFSYKTGIYRHSSHSTTNAKGFHSVRLIGWGEERFGFQTTKFWIAANSWGKWWGEDGFFRILRGSNECQIESYVLSSIADVHDNVRTVRRSGRRASKD